MPGGGDVWCRPVIQGCVCKRGYIMVAHYRPSGPNRCRLRLSVEQLEKRLLLDGSPWQNPNDPLDVTGDNRVSAIDVLSLITDLQANGARELAPPSPDNSPPPYIDVDGDGYAGPSDARRIIDELNGSGSSELPAGTLVGFRLSITDASGGVIDRVAVGTEFVLQVHVQDLRQSPEIPRGVFAAYLDVAFDPPERSTLLPSQIAYGASYPVLPYAEIGEGLVDEVGAAANGPLDGNEHLLFTLPFRAERQGGSHFPRRLRTQRHPTMSSCQVSVQRFPPARSITGPISRSMFSPRIPGKTPRIRWTSTMTAW